MEEDTRQHNVSKKAQLQNKYNIKRRIGFPILRTRRKLEVFFHYTIHLNV
jgi:hypothetical protein